ncbi:IclR family transcriptional regulator [Naasia sp. SYSU D00057]|uniref:IclR family transcriptional regulator n=1 Tax=Naasia sp. SYSU D00057 TaxID=2817380 RepID=UPI001B31576D|nr:IclR family transcriptional regulator [Naasia sp. SYSU D00057]
MDTMSGSVLDLSSISGSAKGLVKGVAVVDLLAGSPRPLRLTDIGQRTGLPHATAVRLVDVLVELGVVRLDGQNLYRLGPRVAGWGQAFLDSFDLTRLAADILDGLVAETNETCFLGVLDRDSVLYVAAVSSPQPVRPAARTGSRNPLHCTGIGKALLAYTSPEKRAALLAGELVRRTENTITDRDALAAELDRIRNRGYATDEIENEEGVRCVAAPVRDHHGDVVAAISVSAPAYRFSHEDVHRLAPRVVAAAAELSARAGYRATASPASIDSAADDAVVPQEGTTT